jgi:general secretion pathway protein D
MATKNNLIMFIRPKILRDQAQAAYETDLKYNYMRDQQNALRSPVEDFPALLPNSPPPKLQSLPPPPPPGQAPTAAPSTAVPLEGVPQAAPHGAAAPPPASPQGVPAPEATAQPATPPPKP